jgi:glutathione S-transferase
VTRDLYVIPGSAAMAAQAALEEAGLEYEQHLVDQVDRSSIHGLNPHARVPVLVEGDLVMYEAAAIIMHVADKVPESALLPHVGTGERALAYRWLTYLTNTVQATFMWRLYPERLVGKDEAAQAAVVAGSEVQLTEMFDVIDAGLEGHTYLLGPFSGADLYLHMLTRWGRHLDRQAWSRQNLGEHYRRLSERPSVARMLERQGIAAYPEPG